MNSTVIYRMPNQTQVNLITGYSVNIGTDMNLSELSGFVVAPFSQNEITPRLLITCDNVTSHPSIQQISQERISEIDSLCADNAHDGMPITPGHRDYHNDYQRFHSQLISGRFTKIVLSRLHTVNKDQLPTVKTPFKLFAEACANYPRMFVCLLTTPESGTWLIATPELLIDSDGNRCHTMALAGTMPWHDGCESQWKAKDLNEQRIVAEYIQSVLSRFTNDISISQQYTARAGGLAHLRNDFEFSIAAGQLGGVVDALFPTPAVCGLPKEETWRYIVDNEYSDRLYYSGYCGPVNLDGTTALYVSLRCMSINSDGYDIYAGGGLLADSREADEWNETTAKMQTMTALIHP